MAAALLEGLNVCVPGMTGEELARVRRRYEARQRAVSAQKCDALRAVDRAADGAYGVGASIGDVLRGVLPELETTNVAAADTVRRLLKLEGY